MKTRIQNLIIALAGMGFLGIPTASQAQFTFSTTSNSTITITGYTGSGGAVFIPNATNGLPVTRISASAFENKTNVTSMAIPDSVITIGDNAFENCSSLTNVTIGTNLTSIGNGIFFNCTRLMNVTIPNNVTSVGNNAFQYCTALINEVVPDSVTNIGNFALSGCTSLTNIVIGASVTVLGEGAFEQCTNLTSVTIPNSVISVGTPGDFQGVFGNCTGLTNVIMGTNVSFIGNYAFLNCGSLMNVAMPSTATNIGSFAFYNCGSLTSIGIPDGVSGIAGGLFSNCHSLTNVVIPNSVTVIGSGAFEGCIGLTRVSIGTNVVNIGSYAFLNCSALTSITIPRSVIDIGDNAFAYCASLYVILPQGDAPGSDISACFYAVPGTIYYLPESTGWGTGYGGAPAVLLPSVPLIVLQPQSEDVSIGHSSQFNVIAVADTSLVYQWMFNGNPIAEATNATLTLPTVTTNDAGNYTVVITDANSSMTSSLPAMLTVYVPLSINTQPLDQTVWSGANATFDITISGTGPLSYHWLLNGDDVPSGIITTIAGTGGGGYSGDGGAATNAELNHPYGVVLDAFGNLFITDEMNNVIRKVDTNGIITTVAGIGARDYSGDGGAATNASLNAPDGVTLDAFGNLIIADSVNNAIRKVDINGIITTVAGNGTSGYSGDGGPATNANFNTPYGVAADAFGNLFIADSDNSVIRKVDMNGIVTTVAGNGIPGYSGDGGSATNASLNYPERVTVDAAGNLFIADSLNNVIRKVDTNGVITTIAGNGTKGYAGDGGAATNASFDYPNAVVVDSSHNLFISDVNNHRIREIDTNGIIVNVVGDGVWNNAGDGGDPTLASIGIPGGIAIDALGNLLVSDYWAACVRKVTRIQVTPLQGPTMSLVYVSPNEAGNYQVIVTSPFGSITSSVVNLTVASSPFIYRSELVSNGGLGLNLVSQPGSTNIVLCATNLTPPIVWQFVSTNIAGVNGDWQFTDTTATSATRFYSFLMQ